MILDYDAERIEPRTISDLERLVSKGEGLKIEFKFKAKHPDKIIREMVAFANTSGGMLFLGVDDDGGIPGVTFADEDEYVMVREIEKGISPKLTYAIERVKLPKEREVLIFHFKESEDKPHKVLEEGSQRVYVREADKTIQASKEIREILKGLKKNKSLRFAYGDKERMLMNHLKEHRSITLNKFAKLANIPLKQASRTLILMVLTNVLNYRAMEEEDLFFPV
ncbi:MAG: putative HTH transcriptional regulator [Arcticibacterium sp.]